ncbi:MAG: OsmC family protein [Methyloceanibacter sp.]
MNRERIEETVRLWQAQPDKAKGNPTVIARAEGSEAVMEHGSFSWRTDMPASLGGTNEAPSPTALLLSALAGCAVVFIRDTLAPQLGVTLDAVEATAQCATDARGLLGISGVAPDLSKVALTIVLRSSEPEDAVRRVYQVWQERCPVYLALTKALPVATRLEIKRA